MLECKHQARQIIAMKTRGQITVLPDGDCPIVLAKASVVVPSTALPTPVRGVQTKEAKEPYRRAQSAYMTELFLNRAAGDKSEMKYLTPTRQQWLEDADVVTVQRKVRLNLEFDFKLCPHSPYMESVSGREHLAFSTRPWRNVEEAEQARLYFESFRSKRCLKTLADFDAWEELCAFPDARSALKKAGLSVANLGADGLVGLARRLFLRAYAQEMWGLTKALSYPELAEWLSEQGYGTNVNELKNAKRLKLVAHAVPRTAAVMKFIAVIEARFPGFDTQALLAKAE